MIKKYLKAAYLFLFIPLVLSFCGVDGKICIGVYIFGLLICGIVYNKFKDNENGKTMNDNEMSGNNNLNRPVVTEYLGMGTKDLCLQLLQKMGVEPVKDDDSENSYLFEYLGEGMRVVANNDSKFILLYDTFWKKFPTANLEMVTLARKAVNRTNIEYNGFKLLYTFNEDAMWIHSSNNFLLLPEIPNVEDYFKHMLDGVLFAHKAFDESMFDIMKEEGEKEK